MKNKKNIIIIIITIIFVIAIGSLAYLNNIRLKEKWSKNVIANMQNAIELESSDMTKAYVDLNISKVTKEAATEMVTLYEKYQDKNIDKLYDKFKVEIIKYNGLVDIDKLNNIEDITDDNLKNVLQEIRKNGYKLKAIFGDIIVVKDYAQLAEYTKYVSNDKRIYIDIKNRYEKQLYEYIDNNTLLNEIVQMEKDIKSINNDEIRKEALSVYADTIVLLIEGDEINLPRLYGEENCKDMVNEIENCIAQNANSVTANLLNKFIISLKNDNYEHLEQSINLKEDIQNNIYNYFE